MKPVKIHALADVQSSAIGEGTTVWQFCVVLPQARIGKHCNINAQVFIENDVVIGNDVTIKSGVQVWDGLRIADRVFIGPNVTFTNDFLPRSKRRPDTFLQTVIEHHASIGANATVVGGVRIGAYAMVGAGSVVTKAVPAYALVYGNPAKLKGYVCECGIKLSRDLFCNSCDKQFRLKEDALELGRSED